MTALTILTVTWPTVALVLGLVGMALATVCYALWLLRPGPPLPPIPRELWPGEEVTKVIDG